MTRSEKLMLRQAIRTGLMLSFILTWCVNVAAVIETPLSSRLLTHWIAAVLGPSGILAIWKHWNRGQEA